MRFLLYFNFCYLLIILTSCSESNQKRNDAPQIEEVMLISDREDKTMPLSALYEIESYIPLETDDEVFIGEISKLMVVNDTIWILDNMVEQVMAFSGEGKLISVINQKGEGLGEYQHISDVAVSKDAVYIYDAWSRTMLKFA